MATYDLKCGACGSQFDLFVQGFLKDGDRVCPDCGSQEVEQRFTGFLCGSSSAGGTSTASAAPGCAHGGFT